VFRSIVALLFLPYLLYAKIVSYGVVPASHNALQGKIEILDSVELKFHSFHGIKVRELSDIAYRKNLLYCIGDRGVLYKFAIDVKNDKINTLELLNAVELQDAKSKRLTKIKRDSEGLDFEGKNLLISFEREPRVELRKTDAEFKKKVKIDKRLQHIKNYEGENKALESVAYSKKYGVVTAPELPLYGDEEHIIYAKSKRWSFPQEGGITSFTFMNKNELLILQREHSYFTFQTQIVISKLNLKTKEYSVLARLNSRDGWRLDNFEGLTKIGKNRYLMISDDNDSFFQKTLLVLFKIIE